MTQAAGKRFDDLAARLDAFLASPDAALAAAAPNVADELLAIGETILEIWLSAHGKTPTARTVEGFRLLASFNACRETCRELIYHRNLVCLDSVHPDTARRLRLAAMVARHLALFIGGKLEVAGLGEFCCSSRPLRQHETNIQRGMA
jgi:hypothetical protein